MEITSVSRTPQPLNRAAAAIYVITNEEIRRAGATRIAEALRLAPNLQVAQLDASNYAISARGFNHDTGTANKLQVLFDGRVIYTPLFSGVFWDEPDYPLADIDRIEVISGPAGALWGSNAVNGIINIVTRDSRDTEGGLVDLSGGSLDQTVVVRYGGQAGENASFRIYAMGALRGSMVTMSQPVARTSVDRLVAGYRSDWTSAADAWDKLQGGLRWDWSSGADSVTLQGDIYNGTGDDQLRTFQTGAISGGNLLGRWTRQFNANSTLQAQIYYSRSKRETTTGITATVDSYDIDAQYGFAAGSAHDIVVGGGYRVTEDDFIPGPGTIFLDPPKRSLRLPNGFIQDQISLANDLTLTLGLKAEHNSYTGMEYMPDARIAWTVSDTGLLWGSVSRAVHSPSRFERDLIIPGVLAGGPTFMSENVIAFELGYRGRPAPGTSLSVSAFYNVYDRLRTIEPSPLPASPPVVRNGMKGESFGIEIWGSYELAPWWRVSAGLVTLHKDLRLEPGSDDLFGVQFAGNDPAYQAQLRSSMDFSNNLELDIALRAVDDLSSPRVPGYVEADLRFGWRVTDSFELSLLGTNLLHARHVEFVNPSLPVSAVPRSVTAALRWTF